MTRAVFKLPLVGLLAFATLALLATEVRASPYPLEQVLPKEAAAKLDAAAIKSSSDLLEKGAKARDRKKLAKTAGVPAAELTKWVQMCDLLRIKGLGPEMTRLLGAARVMTAKQLKGQRAAALLKKLTKANEKQKITDNMPSEQHLADWIAQAKKLKPVLR